MRHVPEAVALYDQLGVKKAPLSLIPPAFETPLPPLRPATFPPVLREPPPPALELFDLDEAFAGEQVSLTCCGTWEIFKEQQQQPCWRMAYACSWSPAYTMLAIRAKGACQLCERCRGPSIVHATTPAPCLQGIIESAWPRGCAVHHHF